MRGEVDRLDAETPASTSSFGGFETRRALNLLGRSRVFDPLVTNRLVVAAVEAPLDDQIQLSEASTVTLEPGRRAQVLHHDDGCYPMPRPHLPLMVSAMLAVEDFTGANGATRVVPGSHLIAEVGSVVQMMQACETTISEGSSIMMFPEGTRSMDDELRPFRAGSLRARSHDLHADPPDRDLRTADALPKRGIVLQGRHPIRIRAARSGPPPECFSHMSVEELSEHVCEFIADEVRKSDPGAPDAPKRNGRSSTPTEHR